MSQLSEAEQRKLAFLELNKALTELNQTMKDLKDCIHLIIILNFLIMIATIGILFVLSLV